MPDTGTPRIAFPGHRRPAVEGGDYEITLAQTVTVEPTGEEPRAAETFTVTRGFTVAGERFALPPSAIRSMFPPPGSLGDHGNALPHIILERPTLPWERHPCTAGEEQPPWLALLLFAEDERPEPKVKTLGTVAGDDPYLPALVMEGHQTPDDPVTVIDVAKGLLAEILPGYDDLALLAHVRSGDGDDAAVVACGRLPIAGATSTVHLVSLEHRFHAVGSGPPELDTGTGGPDSLVRLISLASWRFACIGESQTFSALVRDLARRGGTYRLPDTGLPEADHFLGQGFAPVAHQLRQGGRSVAWYRGPLVTGPLDGPVAPVRTADALLRFHPGVGMFDLGHAAAWQLGRLLALQSTDIATALYEWRRRRAQKAKREAAAKPDDYPLEVLAIDDTLPPGVESWLGGLARLEGVPFGYLVPDERLLPPESIRFLGLDQEWVRYLVDGAYGIGRLSRRDTDLDEAHPLPLRHPRATGALIRSKVVAGYPGLLVDAYAGKGTDHPLPPIRVERLSTDIMLCLFEGDVARLDLHQRPEEQHLAVELEAGRTFGKSLRAFGNGSGPVPAAVTGLTLGRLGTLPVAGLASEIAAALKIDRAAFSAGHLALQLTETADRVTFLAAR